MHTDEHGCRTVIRESRSVSLRSHSITVAPQILNFRLRIEPARIGTLNYQLSTINC